MFVFSLYDRSQEVKELSLRFAPLGVKQIVSQ